MTPMLPTICIACGKDIVTRGQQNPNCCFACNEFSAVIECAAEPTPERITDFSVLNWAITRNPGDWGATTIFLSRALAQLLADPGWAARCRAHVLAANQPH